MKVVSTYLFKFFSSVYERGIRLPIDSMQETINKLADIFYNKLYVDLKVDTPAMIPSTFNELSESSKNSIRTLIQRGYTVFDSLVMSNPSLGEIGRAHV